MRSLGKNECVTNCLGFYKTKQLEWYWHVQRMTAIRIRKQSCSGYRLEGEREDQRLHDFMEFGIQ